MSQSKLTPERWQQIDALYAQALEQPAEERLAFVKKAAGDDQELVDEVIVLLTSEEEAEQYLGESVTSFAEPLLPGLQQEINTKDVNQQIGPYHIIKEIGRGGMGVVYLAERDDDQFKRRVALKCIKRGMDSDEIVQRFRYERQILATLQHPNIAHLHDGGLTDDGQPYLVMEYVDGERIDQYCDKKCLTVDERLALFQTVCRAVQYAHQNLIVHRDLKPSNILVSEAGEVKLLDFGVAKLLSDESAVMTAPVTRTGVRVMTPEYASPEQVYGEAITTASDVYALGIILYELLTGRRPMDTDTETSDETKTAPVQKIQRPSTVIIRAVDRRHKDGTTENLSPEAISTSRSTSVDRLRRNLKGDLDTILLTALQSEPERRYASAEAFVEDIKRHLAGLPVHAQPDTAGYRLRKFVQRHQAGVVAATAFVLLLTGFAITMTIQAQRISEERDAVRLERDKATEVAVFLENLFDASDPFTEERLDTMRVRTLLERGAAQVQDSLADQPLVQAQMLTVIGRVYSRLGLPDQARPFLEQALATRRQLLESPSPEIAETLTQLGDVLYNEAAYEAAEQAFREALAIQKDMFGEEHKGVAGAMSNHALSLHVLGRHDEADSLFRGALAIQKQVLGEEHILVATTMSTFADLLDDRGDYDQAERLFEESLAMRRSIFGENHPSIAVGLNNLGTFLRNRLRYDEAEPLLREAIEINRATLGPEHPNLIENLNILASVLRSNRDYEAAEPIYQEVLAQRRKRLGNDHPDVSITLDSYATLLRAKKDFESAERMQREAIAIARKAFGNEHMAIAITTGRLASIIRESGDPARALPVFREALSLYERLLTAEHPNVAVLRSNLGGCLTDLGRYPEAESLFLKSYQTLLDSRGREDRLTQSTVRYLVTLYKAWGQVEKVVEFEALLNREE